MSKLYLGTKELFLQLTECHEGKLEQELKEETWRQELKQRPLKNATNCFVPYDLLSLYFYTTYDHLFMGGTAHICH